MRDPSVLSSFSPLVYCVSTLLLVERLSVCSERVKEVDMDETVEDIRPGELQLPQAHPSSLRASRKTAQQLGCSDVDSVETVQVDRSTEN